MIEENDSHSRKPSLFYFIEVFLIVLALFAAIYIYNRTIDLLATGKVDPLALTSIAIAAIGTPGTLIGLFYNHNTKRYKCRNERTVQLAKNGNHE